VVVRYDGVVEDITERKLAQIELETDLQIQQALKSILEISLQSIPMEEMLERVLETLFAVPFVALESKGAIFLADDKTESLVMKAQHGLSHELLGLCHKVPYGSCLCGRAVVDRQIVFSQCLDHRHEREYPGMIPHGHYCVPIASNDHVLGVLNLYVRDGHERKEVEELFLLSVASTLAGVIERRATERSLRSTRVDLIAAERIQQHLLPHSSPAVPGYDIHGVVIPAEFAAGDYFDYLTMADGSFGIVVGDVTGHGLGASLLAASTQARIKTLTEMPLDIDEILSHVNKSLAQEVVEGVFITTILARIDLQSHTLSYVNAGHPPGYAITSDGTIKTALPSTEIPLAVLPNIPFKISGSLILDPGDVVVFLTDGIPEARSGDDSFFGTEQTNKILAATCGRSAREMTDSLLAAVREFTGRATQRDDMTVVVVKRLPL
jgi:serine phosphatase RsbU (regulator of sigma subunit)